MKKLRNRILMMLAVMLALTTLFGAANAAPDWFFREHLKMYPYEQRADGSWAQLGSIACYSKPYDTSFVKNLSTPVEVVGAVKNTYNNIWWVTKEGYYIWSGHKWDGTCFVKTSDTDSYLWPDMEGSYGNVNVNYRTQPVFNLPDYRNVCAFPATIGKGVSYKLTGTLTCDTGITNILIDVQGTTVSGQSYSYHKYLNGNTVGNTFVNVMGNKNYFTRTSMLLGSTLPGMSGALFGDFDTKNLEYGSYTMTVTVWAGVVHGLQTSTNPTAPREPERKIWCTQSFRIVDTTARPSSITAGKLSVAVGKTGQLKATINPATAQYTSLTWSKVSDGNNCITLTSAGKVTANKAGTAKVRATVTWTDLGTNQVKTASSECVVTAYAQNVPVSGITLNASQLEMVGTGTAQLTATVSPSSATDKTLAWSIEDTSVATVDQNGQITPLRNGKTTITVRASDGSGVAAYCQVTVRTSSPTNPLTLTLNQNTSGNIGYAGQQAYYRFTPSLTGLYTFQIRDGVYPDAFLYDSSWHQIGEDDSGNLNLSTLMSRKLTAGQDYYCVVGKPDASYTGSFTISVNKESDAWLNYAENTRLSMTESIPRGGELILNAHLPENLDYSFRTEGNGSVTVQYLSEASAYQSKPEGTLSGVTRTNMFVEKYEGLYAGLEYVTADFTRIHLLDSLEIDEPGKHKAIVWLGTADNPYIIRKEMFFTVENTAIPTLPAVTFSENTYQASAVWGTIESDGIEELYARGQNTTNPSGTHVFSETNGRLLREGKNFIVNVSEFGEGQWTLGLMAKINGAWTRMRESTSYSVHVTGVSEDWEYSVGNGSATITKYTGMDTTVTTPATLGGYPVTRIGQGAFTYTGVENLTVSYGVTEIAGRAFYNCFGLKTLQLPGSVSIIGKNAFGYNMNLQWIAPGNTAFDPRNGLQAGDTMSSDGTRLVKVMPARGNAAESYSLAGTVQEIDNYALEYTPFSEIILPEGLKTIGDNAFTNSHIHSVQIPATVTGIGRNAFCLALELERIDVSAGNQAYTSVDGVLFSRDMTTLIAYPAHKQNRTYTVPEGVKTIAPYAFSDAVYLKNLILPDSLTSIEEVAFTNCSSLVCVHLPDQLQRIGRSAFIGCSALCEIAIPRGVTYMGDRVFYLCDETLTIHGTAGTLAEEYAAQYRIPFAAYNPVSRMEDDRWAVVIGQRLILKPVIVGEDEGSSVTNGQVWYDPVDNEVATVTEDGKAVINGAGLTTVTVHSCDNPSVTATCYLFGYTAATVECETAFEETGDLCLTIHTTAGTDYGVYGLQFIPEGLDASWELVEAKVTGTDGTVRLLDCEDGGAGTEGERYLNVYTKNRYREQGVRRGENDLPSNGDYTLTFRCSNLAAQESGTVTCPIQRIGFYYLFENGYMNGLSCTAPNQFSFDVPQCAGGTWGDNLTWKLFRHVLTISGTGAMHEGTGSSDYPWNGKTITELVIEPGVTTVANHAFEGANGLASVTLPDSLVSIGDSAFRDDPDITEINLPAAVETIGAFAFNGCSIEEAVLPDSLTSIQGSSFGGSTGDLKNLMVSAGNPSYVTTNGVLYTSGEEPALVKYPEGKDEETWAVPEGVTGIGSYAFSWCNRLQTLDIPESVSTLGQFSIYECAPAVRCYVNSAAMTWAAANDLPLLLMARLSEASDLVFPADLTAIGQEAFLGSAITALVIPDRIQSVGAGAFAECPDLQLVYVGEQTEMEYGAFANSPKVILCGEAGGNVARYAQNNGLLFAEIVR